MFNRNSGRGVVRGAWLAVLVLVVGPQVPAGMVQTRSASLAIVGATVIDGNGGAPLRDATVVVMGNRITAVGPRASTAVPAGATTIDGTGRFVTPGFIDTNVHVSLYSNLETLARYQPRTLELTLEGAQLHLKHGITTIRDSYGQLPALVEVRDAVASGKAIGPRMLVAGNIVGWGGPFSVSFSVLRDQGLSLFQEQMNDLLAQDAGEELMDMTPEELRGAINRYLDKRPDFIRYGGTGHFSNPTFIGFSPDAQRAIVDETHKRGLVAETHSTSIEGLRLSILAGIDLIQHPEALTPQLMPDDLTALIVERKVICAVLSNTIAGPAWQRHLKRKTAAQARHADALADMEAIGQGSRTKTLAARRQEERDLDIGLEKRRLNAQKLIRTGALITVATDNYLGAAPEFRRETKPLWQEPGLGSLHAIEGLVELGMSPAEALVAATKNGAIASRLEKDLGTVEVGKIGDLLLLNADPLADISNIRALHIVIRDGQVIDTDALPTDPVFSSPAQPSSARPF